MQFRIFRGEQQYVAECLNLAIVTEAPTLDQLAANIHEAASLAEDPAILATLELELPAI